MRRWTIFVFAGLALGSILTGCNKANQRAPYAEPHPVHGSVTFSNKTPLKGGMITFTPKDSKSGVGGQIYEVAGLVDAKGNYELTMPMYGDGAAIGVYQVKIEPREGEIPGSNSNKIPKQYTGYESPLEATVVEGDNKIDFVLR